MSFRARLAMVAAAAVALAIVAASFVVYFVVRDQLRSTVDDSLRATALQLADTPLHDFQHFAPPSSQLGDAPGYPQIVGADGEVFLARGARTTLPVNNSVIGIAQRGSGELFMDAHVNRVHVRIATFPYHLQPGVTVQIARPLTEVDHSLGRIENYLILPRIMGKAIDLSAPTVIITLLIGSSLAGLGGAIACVAGPATSTEWTRNRFTPSLPRPGRGPAGRPGDSETGRRRSATTRGRRAAGSPPC